MKFFQSKLFWNIAWIGCVVIGVILRFTLPDNNYHLFLFGAAGIVFTIEKILESKRKRNW